VAFSRASIAHFFGFDGAGLGVDGEAISFVRRAAVVEGLSYWPLIHKPATIQSLLASAPFGHCVCCEVRACISPAGVAVWRS
jgi:hypothetical protein